MGKKTYNTQTQNRQKSRKRSLAFLLPLAALAFVGATGWRLKCVFAVRKCLIARPLTSRTARARWPKPARSYLDRSVRLRSVLGCAKSSRASSTTLCCVCFAGTVRARELSCDRRVPVPECLLPFAVCFFFLQH